MKRNEQMILGSLAIVGLIAAFWLLVLSPKRDEASQLQDEVVQLHSSLEQAQQDIAVGEQASKSFKLDYRRMVVLGKAVPTDSDQTSLVVQVQNLAERSGVEFQSISLGDASSQASTTTPAPTATAPTTTAPTDSSSTSSTETSASTESTSTSTIATATEASAALLPIGAAVGSAGLPVMPYDMSFTGNFSQIADFMNRLDALVHVRGGSAEVRGRLLTVDSFTLTPTEVSSTDLSPAGSPANPELTADLSVTTYLSPAGQGVTAGATPSGPGATTASLASSTTSTDSTATTSTETGSTTP